jgi:glyoxylase-like metal-dependent hydrolase (beta-lactamase superfamily II)
MAEVKVLIEGHARETKSGWEASSTVTLIKDSGKNIIVDPGINRKLLLEKLKEEKLPPKDINVVFLTHYHPDHALMAGIFENALVADGDTIYEEDKETSYKGVIPGTNLTAIKTPGHAYEHFSLLALTKEGKIVVAGDVFWWTEGQEQKVDINQDDPFAKDETALEKSRKELLKTADLIIPGHGKPFRPTANP